MSQESMADCSALHQAWGSTSVQSGCGARPERTNAPESASRTTTLHDWVDESTPATRVMRRGPSRRRSASPEDVLDGKLIQAHESVPTLAGAVGVVVLEARGVGQ